MAEFGRERDSIRKAHDQAQEFFQTLPVSPGCDKRRGRWVVDEEASIPGWVGQPEEDEDETDCARRLPKTSPSEMATEEVLSRALTSFAGATWIACSHGQWFSLMHSFCKQTPAYYRDFPAIVAEPAVAPKHPCIAGWIGQAL